MEIIQELRVVQLHAHTCVFQNRFLRILANVANIGFPANLIIALRTASKLCAWSWSQSRNVFHLVPISSVIS